jgi:predicted permease
VQVALSIILLVGSGLLIRSLANLRALNPGFDATGLFTAELEVPRARYPEASDRHRFFADFLGEVRGTPGLQEVAIASHLPIRDIGNVYRASAQGSADEPVRIHLRAVFPGYFEALGIPLLSGRDVADGEEVGSPWVVVLSQTAADRLFPEGSPLGRMVELPFTPGPRVAEVVGTVGDVRLSRLEDEPEAAVYVPYAHHARTRMRLALRSSLPPGSLTPSLKETLARMDPEVPLSPISSLEDEVAESMAKRRVVTLSLTLLAVLPLFLASVGLFAVLAYYVSRRRHEMGVRMALGAEITHVSNMILIQGARMVGVGVALGLVGAVFFTAVLRSLLFGVEARDPATFLAVVVLVMAVAALACAVPVWRATRADPRVVLEAE